MGVKRIVLNLAAIDILHCPLWVSRIGRLGSNTIFLRCTVESRRPDGQVRRQLQI